MKQFKDRVRFHLVQKLLKEVYPVYATIHNKCCDVGPLNIMEVIKGYCAECNIPLELNAKLRGLGMSDGKRIFISSWLQNKNDAELLFVFFHELAHHKLHADANRVLSKKGITRIVRELEADFFAADIINHITRGENKQYIIELMNNNKAYKDKVQFGTPPPKPKPTLVSNTLQMALFN